MRALTWSPELSNGLDVDPGSPTRHWGAFGKTFKSPWLHLQIPSMHQQWPRGDTPTPSLHRFHAGQPHGFQTEARAILPWRGLCRQCPAWHGGQVGVPELRLFLPLQSTRVDVKLRPLARHLGAANALFLEVSMATSPQLSTVGMLLGARLWFESLPSFRSPSPATPSALPSLAC